MATSGRDGLILNASGVKMTSPRAYRSSRIKLLVHDGFGVWCAARRLNQGGFEWPRNVAADATPLVLTQDQFNALVLGLPWRRLEQLRSITRM